MHRVRVPQTLTAKATNARPFITDGLTIALAGTLLMLAATSGLAAAFGGLVLLVSAVVLMLYARAVLLGADRLTLTPDVLICEGAFIPQPLPWAGFTRPFVALQTRLFSAVLFRAPAPLSPVRTALATLTGFSHILPAHYGLDAADLAATLNEYAEGGPLIPEGEDGPPAAPSHPAWLDAGRAPGNALGELFEQDKLLKLLSWVLPGVLLLTLLLGVYFLHVVVPFKALLAEQQTMVSPPFPADVVIIPLVPFFVFLVAAWAMVYRLVAGRHVFAAPGAWAASLGALYLIAHLTGTISARVHNAQTAMALEHDFGVCSDPGPAHNNATLVLRAYAQQIGCDPGQVFAPDPSVLP
jgi:hypothetical protein